MSETNPPSTTGNQAHPSTSWREVVAPDEEQIFRTFAREIEAQQQEFANMDPGRRVRRGFHAKTHVGLMAEFLVLADLPEYARFGVFKEPGPVPAVVRFSNGEPGRHPDKHPEPRGIAIKLVGVTGPKLPDHAGAVTQDFLATSHSVTSTVRNARQFMAFIRASRNRRTLPLNLAREVGFLESLRILTALTRTVLLSRVTSMATEHYSGTAPITCGPHAVKFTVQPAESTAPTTNPQTDRVDFLREDLANRLRQSALVFDFFLQFYVDEQKTPIEDTSVEWKPTHSPRVKVAQLRIPSCRLDDPRVNASSEAIEQLSFSPWHALEDHRPLGSVMRARRFAYPASARLRASKGEPTSLPLTPVPL